MTLLHNKYSLPVALLVLVACGIAAAAFLTIRMPTAHAPVADAPLSLPLSEPLVAPAVLPTTVIIYGDSRNGETQHRALVSLMEPLAFDAVIHVGDVAYEPNDAAAWATFWEIVAPLRERAPFWIIAGNHDTPESQFDDYFAAEEGNHQHTINGTTFLLLDLEKGIDEAPTYIRENTTAKTVVIMHYPVFTGGPHRTDSIVQKADALRPVFQDMGIQLVFSGHDHNYQRIVRDGITYIVTGGGGAPLYSITEDVEGTLSAVKAYHFVELTIDAAEYQIKTIDIDGNIIDETAIHFASSF